MSKKPGEKIRIVKLEEACLWLENHDLIESDSEDLAGTIYGWMDDLGYILHDPTCVHIHEDMVKDGLGEAYHKDVESLFEEFGTDGILYVDGS